MDDNDTGYKHAVRSCHYSSCDLHPSFKASTENKMEATQLSRKQEGWPLGAASARASGPCGPNSNRSHVVGQSGRGLDSAGSFLNEPWRLGAACVPESTGLHEQGGGQTQRQWWPLPKVTSWGRHPGSSPWSCRVTAAGLWVTLRVVTILEIAPSLTSQEVPTSELLFLLYFIYCVIILLSFEPASCVMTHFYQL